eukprot:1160334-Pelagomonas_calceolata.AAC.4
MHFPYNLDIQHMPACSSHPPKGVVHDAHLVLDVETQQHPVVAVHVLWHQDSGAGANQFAPSGAQKTQQGVSNKTKQRQGA